MQKTSTQAGGFLGVYTLQDMTCETVDISYFLDFGLYYHVSYKYNDGIKVTSIGRWLGVYHRVGRIMSYWILTKKEKLISRTTVKRLANLEKDIYKGRSRINEFDIDISRSFKEAKDLTYYGPKTNPED